MVRGHICMLQRNRDIYYYYYDYYFQYNTQLKVIACQPKLCHKNLEIQLVLREEFYLSYIIYYAIIILYVIYSIYFAICPLRVQKFCRSHSDVPLYFDGSLIILNLLCHQKDVFLWRNVCVVNYQPWNFLMTPL